MPLIELPHTPGCLVCGRQNPVGLHLSLFVDTDTAEIRTRFTPGPQHIGFEGILHGGVLATVLDEAMVWAAIWTSKKACVAGELNVRFRKSAPVGEELHCLAKVKASRSRLVEVSGELALADGTPIASGFGKYVPLAGEPTAAFMKTLVDEPPTSEAVRLLAVHR